MRTCAFSSLIPNVLAFKNKRGPYQTGVRAQWSSPRNASAPIFQQNLPLFKWLFRGLFLPDPLKNNPLKELHYAVKNYGPNAPFSISLLEGLSGGGYLTPVEWLRVTQAALSREQFLSWKADFIDASNFTGPLAFSLAPPTFLNAFTRHWPI